MSQVSIPEQQLRLLHHTLGLRPDQRESHRNHYLAGPGHYAMPDLEALVKVELMVVGRTPAFCDPTDVVFHVSEEGKRYALQHLPLPPKKTKFAEYLDWDCCESFGDWLLGGMKPKVEWRESGGKFEYRMYRCRQSEQHSEVKGEWCRTQKDAKASYKSALRQHRQTMSQMRSAMQKAA
ncbi:TPA: hypothetical protein NII19_006765 [Pseudomonas aeruginosa]|nr:hypothetical protein [Pseudomonas aeruginosa]HCF4748192.1 hypothetical protein [Pseudomonas aeruginosa]HCF4768636.1 hypothetical protein [Pseudomonas aeruginosa]HCF6284475.1 hypothetical protein [Pseudomonas aeruginosa]HCF6291679.1 hypothetical protein [Pseudomonas aeruginosa]